MATPLKHRWSLGHNYLAGISAGDWWRLLRQNRFRVAPAYWHRGLFITLVSFVNSWVRRLEERRYGKRVRATEISEPPLFILGHWRSGTTHLHNLLAVGRGLRLATALSCSTPGPARRRRGGGT